jgi:hypothetical protein
MKDAGDAACLRTVKRPISGRCLPSRDGWRAARIFNTWNDSTDTYGSALNHILHIDEVAPYDVGRYTLSQLMDV